MRDEARADRRAKLAIAAVIVAGVLLRLLVVRAQGFPSDVETFEAWAERMAQVGSGHFYQPGYFSDYPPAFLYVLWLLGALLHGEPLRLAVKAISIPADVAIALLGAAVVWRSAGRAVAVSAASLWMLAPGQIFAGPYWGQVDAVGTLPLLAALLAAGRRRWASAALLGALAAMVKPQFGIGLIVIAIGVAFESWHRRDWRPIARAGVGALAATAALALPFGAGPTELVGLVRTASETYPYTSLFAFNAWSVLFDFWKPDDPYVVVGAVVLGAGLLASGAPLWRRRDTAAFLAAGAFAAFAFYFLPTRAHERYLFPAFALLLPFAAARARLVWPYVTLAITFALTLYFAFTRYPQTDLRTPDLLEATLFGRWGQIGIALVLMAAAVLVVWRLARGEMRLDASIGAPTWSASPSRLPTAGPRLPAGLGRGHLPTRRDLLVALVVALTVLVTRGYRLDQPRDMYFDEVYHARTAFELLAQREPYEWTHPHLAKEIMALGILAFGDDRVTGHEAAPSDIIAFSAANDGTRVYQRGLELELRGRGGGDVRTVALGTNLRAAALEGGRIVGASDDALFSIPTGPVPSNFLIPKRDLPVTGPPTSFVSAGGHLAVATRSGVAVYVTFDADPLVVPTATVAMTAKPDGTELFLLDPQGTVHLVDPATGLEQRTLSGGGAGVAIAYALGPNRVFVARADAAVLDVYELEGGRHEEVPLANARTGSFQSGATALALVPRTQFLYALADGRVVVIEPHGASPFAAIPTSGTRLGIDGTADELLVAGPNGVDRIPTGRHALAWRLPGVVFAALLAFFVVLLARRLFASPLVAAFAATAVVLDGSLFAQSRIGMNDVYVGALIVAAWYFIVAAHEPRRSATVDILLAGVLVGLAVAAKWAAVYTLAGVFVASVAVTAVAYERGRKGSGGPLDLLAGRGRNAALLFASFAVIPLAIYLGSYVRWFGGPTIPYGWNLVELTQQMYWYHSGLTAPHPAGSPWWSWPFVLKPVYWYFGQSEAGNEALIYDAGNVALFWAGVPAFAWCVLAAIRARSITIGFVVFAALAQYVAWIPISRVLFFYHFFTALPFYLLALAVALTALWERGRQTLVTAYLALAAGAGVYFYAFISGQPVPSTQAGMFFILPTWQYDCQFYPQFTCPLAGTPDVTASGLLTRLAAALAVAAAFAAIVALARRPALVMAWRTTLGRRVWPLGRTASSR